MADVIDCTRFEELLAVATLGALPAGEGPVVTEHLARCPECRRIARSYAVVTERLPSALTPITPPARLRRSVMSQVYAEAAASRSTRPRVWERVWRAIPVGRPFTIAAAAAAGFALCLGVWGAVRSTPGTAPRPEAHRVTGTTAQPAAVGSLIYDPEARRSTLAVHGLLPPVNPTGGPAPVYEVWLIPSHGSPVGAGFLTLQPDGQTWAAVVDGDLHGYSALAATTEPAGGTRTPTGSQVITATLQ